MSPDFIHLWINLQLFWWFSISTFISNIGYGDKFVIFRVFSLSNQFPKFLIRFGALNTLRFINFISNYNKTNVVRYSNKASNDHYNKPKHISQLSAEIFNKSWYKTQKETFICKKSSAYFIKGEIQTTKEAKWIIGNVFQCYYYRVNYDDDMWFELTSQLIENHTVTKLA